jgi:hypothetical protein
VTLNGEPAPSGVGIVIAVLDADGMIETECARTTTVEGGSYAVALSSECSGKTVQFLLAAREDIEGATIDFEGPGQVQNVDFGDLSEELLSEFGVGGVAVSGAVEDAVVEALKEKGEQPLIEATQLWWIMFTAIMGAFALLAYMVQRRGEAMKLFIEKGIDTDKVEGPFKRQIEAMVLVMVVLSVIILGVTEKIGEEGLVSVLAAIAGYGVGRASNA